MTCKKISNIKSKQAVIFNHMQTFDDEVLVIFSYYIIICSARQA